MVAFGRLRFAPAPVAAALTTAWPSGFVGCGVRRTVGAFLFGSAVAAPCGRCCRGRQPVSLRSAPDIESSGLFVYAGCSQPPARCSVLWPSAFALRATARQAADLLADPGVAQWAKTGQVRTRCLSTGSRPRACRGASRHDRRIYLRNWTVRLRCVVPARRVTSALLCGSCPSARRFGAPSGRSSRFGLALSLRSGHPSLPLPGRLPFRSWLRVVVGSCYHDRSSYRGLTPHLQRAHAGRTQNVGGGVFVETVSSRFLDDPQ